MAATRGDVAPALEAEPDLGRPDMRAIVVRSASSIQVGDPPILDGSVDFAM